MSGGSFEYRQYNLDHLAEDIERVVSNNNKKDKYGYATEFSDSTISEFKQAIKLLKRAAVYAQRIDWLVSGDDSEACFHKRLKEELNTLDEESKPS